MYMTPQLVEVGPSEMLSELCRITEETVDELSQENGPYKPIHFKEKYAKRVVMQYTVSSSVECCYHAALMQQLCHQHADVPQGMLVQVWLHA